MYLTYIQFCILTPDILWFSRHPKKLTLHLPNNGKTKTKKRSWRAEFASLGEAFLLWWLEAAGGVNSRIRVSKNHQKPLTIPPKNPGKITFWTPKKMEVDGRWFSFSIAVIFRFHVNFQGVQEVYFIRKVLYYSCKFKYQHIYITRDSCLIYTMIISISHDICISASICFQHIVLIVSAIDLTRKKTPMR